MVSRTTSAIALLALLLAAHVGAVAHGAAAYEVYSVRPGDTLASIAQRFGVSESRIAQANGLSADSPLRAGQSLAVPLTPGPESGARAQDQFAAEEKQATDVEATQLTVKPAADARGGPVVGYLGIASADTIAVIDPRRPQRLCAIPRSTNLCVSCQYGDYYGVLMSDGALAWVAKRSINLHPVELVAGIEVPAGATAGANIVRAAFRYYGRPYVYGGAPPAPTDCSGFVLAVFRDCGMRLPRTAAAQFNVGYPVPWDRLAIGDRVYFYSSDGSIGHAGIYIGNGQFIHSSSRRGCVGIDSLRSGFYLRRLAGARRP